MMELPVIRKAPIQAVDLVKYSGASGDFNEIHTIPSIAKQKGFSDIIAHGMLVMGYAAAAINEWFPDRPIASLHVRFQAVTLPGSQLAITGSFSSEEEGVIFIKDENDEVKLKGVFHLKKF